MPPPRFFPDGKVMPHYVVKNSVKYETRRSKNPDKRDIEFLTREERKDHVCTTTKQVDDFCRRHLRRAETAAKDGSVYYIVVDVEKTQKRDFSWHMEELKAQRVSRTRIGDRESSQRQIRGAREYKDADLKAEHYFELRKREIEEGIVPGTVAAIQIAAVDDEKGDLTFAINCQRLVNRKTGLPDLPPSLEKLLTADNVVLINVNQHEDIDEILSSFFRKPIEGIVYIDAVALFNLLWGVGWAGRNPDGQLKTQPGGIDIVEAALPGFTYYKHPKFTMGEWLVPDWSSGQIQYALEDVYVLAMAIRVSMPERRDSEEIGNLIRAFPTPSKSSSGKKGKGSFARDVMRVFYTSAAADDYSEDFLHANSYAPIADEIIAAADHPMTSIAAARNAAIASTATGERRILLRSEEPTLAESMEPTPLPDRYNPKFMGYGYDDVSADEDWEEEMKDEEIEVFSYGHTKRRGLVVVDEVGGDGEAVEEAAEEVVKEVRSDLEVVVDANEVANARVGRVEDGSVVRIGALDAALHIPPKPDAWKVVDAVTAVTSGRVPDDRESSIDPDDVLSAKDAVKMDDSRSACPPPIAADEPVESSPPPHVSVASEVTPIPEIRISPPQTPVVYPNDAYVAMEYGNDITNAELARCEEDGFPPPFKLRAEAAANAPLLPVSVPAPSKTPAICAPPIAAAAAAADNTDVASTSSLPPLTGKRKFVTSNESGLVLDVNNSVIPEVEIDRKAKDQVRAFRKRLNNNSLKAAEFELVDRRFLPEVLAGTLSMNYCAKKKDVERATILIRQLLHLFSYEEKRRFLRLAAFDPQTDMVIWFDLFEWSQFDALMLVNHSNNDVFIRRVVRRLEDDPATLMSKIATWVDFKRPQVLDILRQSPFNNKTYEGFNLGKMESTRLEKFIQMISGFHNLPYPAVLTLSNASDKMDRLAAAFPKRELSPRDLIFAINQAVKSHPDVRCVADAVLGCSETGATYETYRDSPIDQIPHEDECWTSGSCPNAEFLIEVVDDPTKATALIRRLRDVKTPIPVIFRLGNQMIRQQRVVALMLQLPGTRTKYFLETFGAIHGRKLDLLRALFSNSIYSPDVNYVVHAATYTFGLDEELVNNSFVRINNSSRQRLMLPGPRIMAKSLGIKYCPCTRQRVVCDESDIDASFTWHMAQELDISARNEAKNRCAKE